VNAEELNREIAEAMGWVERDLTTCLMRSALHWHDETRACYPRLPDFVNDLNALRDGPEKRLRDAGWFLVVMSPDGRPAWFAEWRGWPDGPEGVRLSAAEFAPTEAEARARAALAALKASQETAGGPATVESQ